MFGFWPQMTPKNPETWGRMTSDDLENHFFLIAGSIASFWYIICLGLKMFGFWPKMTPNTPKWPQPQTYKIKNLYAVLGLNLSYPKLWLVNCITRYLKNKPKPKVAHKTGRRTNFEKLSWYVWFFWSKEPLRKVSAKAIREKYSFRDFCRWDRGTTLFSGYRDRLLSSTVSKAIWGTDFIGSDWLRLVPFWRARCQNAKKQIRKKKFVPY